MDVYELITIITETPKEIADQALEEYERIAGHNDAIIAIFAISAEIREKKKPGTICR